MSDTAGIDLASQDVGTALVRVSWQADGALVSSPVAPCGQQLLRDQLGQDVPVGIDAPFGWPVTFRQAVEGWSTSRAWPHAGWMQQRKARDWHVTQLRLRGTDLFVWSQVGFSPLSVASEKIAVTAMRCVALLANAHEAGRFSDLAGGDGVFEVYPAAALKVWNVLEQGYKNSSNDALTKRKRMLAALADKVPLTFDGTDTRAKLVATDHALDALVSALVARAAARQLTHPPPSTASTIDFELRGRPVSVSGADVETEGWIHLPLEGSLTDLVARG